MADFQYLGSYLANASSCDINTLKGTSPPRPVSNNDLSTVLFNIRKFVSSKNLSDSDFLQGDIFLSVSQFEH